MISSNFQNNKNIYFIFVMLLSLLLQACSLATKEGSRFSAQVTGKWITEPSGKTMLDPQTSGLIYQNGYLYSVSDGSAHETQIQRLHKIAPDSAAIVEKYGPIALSEDVKSSCFVSYLSDRPDYEAIVRIPNRENAWIMVTEDATRTGSISVACQQKYADTGSTLYPTLIVRLEKIEDVLTLTGVRAIQFDKADNLGNYPNDGVEGLAMTRDSKLLLGVERDNALQARIFQLDYSESLFDKLDTFIAVEDAGLLFPKFTEGRHPINGMDVYYPNDSSEGYLIAAARNDHQLWILDLAKQKPANIVEVDFYAPSDTSGGCQETHQIKNTALEGLAVYQNTLYLINDPWKKVYPDNVVCNQDAEKYNMMSPLLFEMNIDPNWLS